MSFFGQTGIQFTFIKLDIMEKRFYNARDKYLNLNTVKNNVFRIITAKHPLYSITGQPTQARMSAKGNIWYHQHTQTTVQKKVASI